DSDRVSSEELRPEIGEKTSRGTKNSGFDLSVRPRILLCLYWLLPLHQLLKQSNRLNLANWGNSAAAVNSIGPVHRCSALFVLRVQLRAFLDQSLNGGIPSSEGSAV